MEKDPHRDGDDDGGAPYINDDASTQYIGSVAGSEVGDASPDADVGSAKEHPDRTLDTIALGYAEGLDDDDAGPAKLRAGADETSGCRLTSRKPMILLAVIIVILGAVLGGVVGAKLAGSEEPQTCRVEGDECVSGNCHKWDGCSGEEDCCCCEGLKCGGYGLVLMCYKP